MLKVEGLSKSFGNKKIISDINFEVANGEVVSIIGPSGTGKTTLLRCINFLEKPDEGIITIDEASVDSQNASPKKIRQLVLKSGMVFQSYNLFNNKTVLENVVEAQVIVGKKKKADAVAVALQKLSEVGMADWKDSYPLQLSGGQQQRVALARAIAMAPSILLLDEPTSALDPELTKEVLKAIKVIAQEGISMLIVTHEIEFARELSDRIIFMDGGEIVEQGSPKELFYRPQEKRTKEFIASLYPMDYQI